MMIRRGLKYVFMLFIVMISSITLSYAKIDKDDEKGTKTTKTDVKEALKDDLFDFEFDDKKPLDSLTVALYNSKILGSYNNFVNDFILLDSMQVENEKDMSMDSIYKARLELMTSVIKLPYNNIVRNYINVYTRNNKMSNILGLSMYYMPMFEQELYNQGLPTELKILPIVESALNPNAVSSAGASGLWQFMYASGKQYGLKVNSFIDERMDPLASTKAACQYLKALFAIYQDWTLALAAYNCGPGNVNKALKRAPNAKTYWDIYYLLPTETRGYVPAFIAATYAYTFHKAHEIAINMPNHTIVTDTLSITNRMLHFEQISSTIGVHIDTIRALNPMYKLDVIPATNATYTLTLPMESINSFIEREQDIYAKSDEYLKKYKVTENLKAQKDGFVTYKVKSGDVLGKIATKYKVKTADIMKWNKIKSAKSLAIGQKLKIFL